MLTDCISFYWGIKIRREGQFYCANRQSSLVCQGGYVLLFVWPKFPCIKHNNNSEAKIGTECIITWRNDATILWMSKIKK